MAATGGGGPLYTNPRLRAELMEVLAERQRESRFVNASVTNSVPAKLENVSSSVERTRILAEAAAAGKTTPKPTTGSSSGGAGITTSSSTRTTSTAKTADVRVSSQPYTAAGYYYDVDLDFALGQQGSNTPSPALTAEEKADWGRNWSKDLVNPKRNCVYLVRTKITQMRFDPLIGGFRIKFVLPAGWALVDGKPLTMYVEVTSNPLSVIRKVRSPSGTIVNSAFTTKVLELFP